MVTTLTSVDITLMCTQAITLHHTERSVQMKLVNGIAIQCVYVCKLTHIHQANTMHAILTQIA